MILGTKGGFLFNHEWALINEYEKHWSHSLISLLVVIHSPDGE